MMEAYVKKFQFKWPPWLWSGLFIFCGLALIYRGLSRHYENLEKQVETIEVLTAKKPFSEGHVFNEEDFKSQYILKKYAPIDSVHANEMSQVAHRSSRKQISQGEIILWSSLDEDYSPSVPSMKIMKGFRAVTISVDEESSVAYLIKTGDHVDVMSTFNTKKNDEPITLTLLQNVMVLSTSSDGSDSGSSYTSLTLMLDPTSAALVRHAQTKGKLSFSLRNPHDHLIGDTNPYIQDHMLYETAFRQTLRQKQNQDIEIIKNLKE